jgi:hypothetical protein
MTSEYSRIEKRTNDEIIIFDAYAWVEYALDGANAGIVKDKLDLAEEAFTPASVIAELKEIMLRHGVEGETISHVIDFIKARTLVVDIDSDISELSGDINFRNKKTIRDWGMLDSMVLAVSRTKRGSILTGDPHFKHLSKVIFIGR